MYFCQIIGPFLLVIIPPTFDGEIAVKYYHGDDKAYLVATWRPVASGDVNDMLKLNYQFAMGE